MWSPRLDERDDGLENDGTREAAAEKTNAKLVDITGGAPEMHPEFRRFVKTVREKGFPVMVRTNLTILLQAGL